MARLDLAEISNRQYVPHTAFLSSDVQSLLLTVLDAAVKSYNWTGDYDEIEALVGQAYYEVMANSMIGAIVPVAGDVPAWGLSCDGSTYDSDDYPNLAAYLGAGATFTVPDLSDRFILASGTNDPGDTGGEDTHTLTTDEMPAHAHTDTGHAHSEITAVATVINGGLEAPAAAATPSVGTTGIGAANIQSTGGGQAHNNMPPFYVLQYVIVAL